MESSKAMNKHVERTEAAQELPVRTTQRLRPVQPSLYTGPFVIRPVMPVQPALRQWENIIA